MKQQTPKISAVIITKNEQERIKKCIQSISFCDEIVVVDNGSTDETVHIARMNNAQVLSKQGAGFADLRNEAIRLAKGEWLLFIDADETVSSELAAEIQSATLGHDADVPIGFLLKRKNYYLGGPWPHVEIMERFFSRGARVVWKGILHETPQFQGIRKTLSGYLIHHTHRTLEEMVRKTNEWSEFEARLRFDSHHPDVVWWRFLRVMITSFFDSFIRQNGFAAGTRGWVESVYQSFSMFITYAKLWERQHKSA